MAFTVINPSEIEVGDAITKDLWDKIKGNFDDHETRLSAQEAAQRRIIIFDSLIINAASASSFTGLMATNAPQDMTLVDCYVQIFEKGTLTGALEIDVKRNSTPDNAGMVSVFTTKPKITYASAADYDKSSNQVFNGAQATVTEGTHLRLDITELPASGVIGKFIVYLVGEVS